MLRVTGGALRGRRLAAPPGRGTRPSADKVKEALFNILGQDLAGLKALDLFAGSGALGIEALSRGARWCLFVERSPAVAKLIRSNLAALGLEGLGRVLVGDALRAGPRLAGDGPFDLVLADPPYQKGLAQPALTLAAGLLAPGGRLAIEHAPGEDLRAAAGLNALGTRSYGQTRLSFFTLQQDQKGMP